MRFSAVWLMMRWRATSSRHASSSGQSIVPGATPFTRTSGARSRASARVSASEPAFRGGVDGVVLHRQLGVDVDDVDDAAVLLPQLRRRRLRQEQRRLEIGADEVVPLLFRDLAHRRRIEARRVVDQRVEPPELLDRGLDELRTPRTP